MIKDNRQFGCKLSSVIMLALFSIILAVLFILEGRYYDVVYSVSVMSLTNNNILLLFVVFLVLSVIQLIPILLNKPMWALIVSVLKTAGYTAYSLLIAVMSPMKQMEVNGIADFFEAYGIRILYWLAFGIGLLAFAIDVLINIIWMVHNSRGKQKSASNTASYSHTASYAGKPAYVRTLEKMWKVCGIVALIVLVIQMLFCSTDFFNMPMSSIYIPVAAVVLSVVWWFASRRSRAWSGILFALLTVCVAFFAYETYAFLDVYGFFFEIPAVQLVAEFMWYVSMIVLMVQRGKVIKNSRGSGRSAGNESWSEAAAQ